MTVFTFSGLWLTTPDGHPAPFATSPIFAKSDTGYATPLAALDMSGTTVLPGGVTADGNGKVPDFKVDVPDGDPWVVTHAAGLVDTTIMSIDEVMTTVKASAASSAASATAAQTAAAAAADTAGSVAAGMSFFKLGITRYNLIKDPRCTAATFTSPGGALTVTTKTGGPLGVGWRSAVATAVATSSPVIAELSASGTSGAPVEAGSTYTLSVYVYQANAGQVGTQTVYLGGNWYSAGGGIVETLASQDSGNVPYATWVRKKWTLVAPPGATYLRATVSFTSPQDDPVGTEYGVAAALLSKGTTVVEYFDGGMSNTDLKGYAWSGAPNASTSQMFDFTVITHDPNAVRSVNGTFPDANGNVQVATGGGTGGVSDHGALSGLGDDDHSQYHTDTRGDARYYRKAEVDAIAASAATQTSNADRNRMNHYGVQPISSVEGLEEALATAGSGGGGGGGAVASVNGKVGTVVLTKSDVGLSNVSNLAPASLPISTATQTALNGKSNTGHVHDPSEVTGLTAALAAKLSTSAGITAVAVVSAAQYADLIANGQTVATTLYLTVG